MVTIVLSRIGQALAEKLVVKNHYSGTYPAHLISLGVYADSKLSGVICFGRGANQNLGTVMNLQGTEVLELTRLWLADELPRNSESQVISKAIRLIKQQLPTIKGLVSYADPNVGHSGIIYQATNWYYVGTGSGEGGIMLKGKVYHRRTLSKKYGTVKLAYLRKHIDPEAKYVRNLRKHLYCYPLTSKVRKHLEHIKKPYPKQDGN